MKRNRIVMMIAVMTCIVLAGTAGAQASAPGAPNTPSAAVGTAFTYQGQIERSGVLYTGTCDLQFSLWDAVTTGTQQGTTLSVNAVTVNNGVFAVELDFGNQFKGEVRWLETAAKCADDVDFTTMTPRTALNPAPYAIGLMPGAQIEGSIAGTPGILRASNNGEGAALVGLANSSTGTTYGVLGNAFSPNGFAVWGYGSNNATGLRGFAADGGRGVWGSSLTWQGIFGESRDNVGVVGTSTNFNGVWGDTAADNAVGVVGWGKDPCDGLPLSCIPQHLRNATGVAGHALANGYGVWGQSANGVSVAGFAVGYDKPDLNSSGFGTPAAMFGGPNGVIGYSKASGGNGVSGVALTSGSVGVAGYAYDSNGYAAKFYGKTATKILEIQGGGDLAELFEVSHEKADPGTLMVIDVTNPGHLAISRSAYDTKVAGIVSGAGDVRPGLILHQEGVMEGDTQVAIAGRVYVKATSSNGSIEPGDLLTTSDVPGYAMKATDHDRSQGAIIGKAMTALDTGEGLVLVLVNLQ